jgi:hypothetical protein
MADPRRTGHRVVVLGRLSGRRGLPFFKGLGSRSLMKAIAVMRSIRTFTVSGYRNTPGGVETVAHHSFGANVPARIRGSFRFVINPSDRSYRRTWARPVLHPWPCVHTVGNPTNLRQQGLGWEGALPRPGPRLWAYRRLRSSA